MKVTAFFTVIFLAMVFVAEAQPFTADKSDEGVWILDKGEKVFFYQSGTKSIDEMYPRANYVHPLYTPDGFEITEDFPADHLHHRGIFWTWHQVVVGDQEIGDAWECRDFVWDVQDVEASQPDEDRMVLKAKIFWKSMQWLNEKEEVKPIAEEHLTITTLAKKDNYRIVDFEIAIRAMENDVKIGGSKDPKGYGGFSVRMKLPADVSFMSAGGVVEPQINQVEAGPWMNISGSLLPGGGKAGVVIINHKDNPMFPEKWILRKARSMQNPAFPGGELFPLSDSVPLILKYRLVVYSATLDNQVIEALQSAYWN